MENLLLINNKSFFDKNQITTIGQNTDITSASILFLGNHNGCYGQLNRNIITKLFNDISHFNKNYIIIIGKTDDNFFENIAIPKNIIKIYANNIIYDHDIIKFLPIGRDFRSINQFNIPQQSEKKNLCYCNFSLDTHPCRKTIFDSIKDKNFLTIENMGTFLNYSISRDDFFKQLNTSKFTLCPKGNAYDTFRFYDCLYCDSIPIVVRLPFHKYFEDLPILFLKSEEDFKDLTAEFLNQKYDELSLKKKKYYKELDFNYWILNIKNELNI